MKNLIVKTLSALLVMLTAVSILSPAASAKSKRIVELRSFENSKIIRCGDELSVVQYDENGKVLSKAANNDANQGVVRASLPSSFDLRSKNAITSVKDQAGTGTCWAFSTIAAIESNAIMKGLRSSNGLDLSEDHLVWFTFHPDKAIGDKVVVSESNDDSDSPYNCGGWWNTAVYSLVNWVGVETEQNAPFDPDDNDRNGHYNDSERYGSTLHVQGVKNLASDNQATRDHMDEIKTSLMENGACKLSFYADSSSFNGYSYYQNATTNANHAVTLIGWDDNYDRSKFRSSTGAVPSKNGAWLIKNSWGADDYGSKDGYFWLSYYDTSVKCIMSFDAYKTDNYDNMHSYTGFMANPKTGYFDTTSVSYANVFKAEKAETLKAVGLWTLQDDIQYTVKIYTGLSASDDPQGGTKIDACTTTGKAPREGYYTINLADTVNLKKNERFAVVVTITAGSHNKLWIPFEGSDWSYSVMHDIPITYSSNRGESYIYLTSGWCDVKDYTSRTLNNALINTYTSSGVKDDDDPTEEIKFYPSSVSAKVGDDSGVSVDLPKNCKASIDTSDVASFCNTSVQPTDSGYYITLHAISQGSGKIKVTANVNGETFTEDLDVSVSAGSDPKKQEPRIILNPRLKAKGSVSYSEEAANGESADSGTVRIYTKSGTDAVQYAEMTAEKSEHTPQTQQKETEKPGFFARLKAFFLSLFGR